MYGTGDLVKYHRDGNIEFIGRVDNQVKIRGYRIELGEIETVLEQSELVSQAVVLAREDKQGNKRLVGYIIAEGYYDREGILAYLKDKLPDYMIPALIMEVETMPLTANGKVDRKALPDPEASELLTNQYVAPSTESERSLARIWEDLLEVEQVGIHDDFFELGGHSLLAAKLLASVESRFGRRVPFSVFFERATIAHLAQYLVAEQRRSAGDEPLVTVQACGRKTPIFFLHGDFSGGGFYCRNLAHFLGEDRPFHAIHPHGLHGEEVPDTIDEMAADRLAVIREIQPRGPYLLGGFCNGALIAYEMARQLEQAGDRVEGVVLIGADASNFKFRHLRASHAALAGCSAKPG